MSADVFAGLTSPYSTIVADPPWHYDEVNPPNPGNHYRPAMPYAGGGLSYSSLSLDEIKALPVAGVADDTRLFLWVTNRYLFDGPDVLRAWGFEPQRRVIVWCKPPMGTLTVTTEFLLIGKRGRPAKMPWMASTWFAWPRPHHAHSRKPEAALDLIESLSPGPYLELFARSPRLGWDSWGHGYETAVNQ